MTVVERHIVETYSELFERLSSVSKNELLEKLIKSIRKETKSKEKEFFKSFGAFSSNKPVEEIVREIKESRRFEEKDLKL